MSLKEDDPTDVETGKPVAPDVVVAKEKTEDTGAGAGAVAEPATSEEFGLSESFSLLPTESSSSSG